MSMLHLDIIMINHLQFKDLSKKEWIKSYQGTLDTAEYIISKYARRDDISLDVGSAISNH